MLRALPRRRGSAIARFVGQNVLTHEEFDPVAKMWVFEEVFDGRKLTEIINTDHENKKYLPGCKLPESIVAGACVEVWEGLEGGARQCCGCGPQKSPLETLVPVPPPPSPPQCPIWRPP